MVFLKILSILLQTYTLPTVQDDFTVLQHHPYEIRRLENRNPSDLAKRDAAIATLYWDSMELSKQSSIWISIPKLPEFSKIPV